MAEHEEFPVPNPRLRAADSDRDAASAALGEHYAMGRLTDDEHRDRLAAAWSARTYGDLAKLFDDLPPPRFGDRAGVRRPGAPATGTGGATGATPAERRRSGPVRTFAARLTPALPVLIAVAVVATLIVKGPWPLLLLAGWWWWSSSGGRRRR